MILVVKLKTPNDTLGFPLEWYMILFRKKCKPKEKVLF